MDQVLLAPNKMPSLSEHEYPMLASLKMDGRRCLVHKGRLYSRTMKDQPNLHLPAHLAKLLEVSKKVGLTFDGELYSHDIPFDQLERTFKSHDAAIHPTIAFHCFDMMRSDQWGHCLDTFEERYRALSTVLAVTIPNVVRVKQKRIDVAAEAEATYQTAIAAGYEGLILRTAHGLYKHGRATVNENIIFKVKAFETSDAKVIGYEEQVRLKAGIERETNEMGRTARTYKQDDYEPAGTMGALRVVDERGRTFNLGWGRGWTHLKRAELWRNRQSLLTQWVEFRYMVAGEKDLPRMPQLLRFREAKA